MAERHETLLRSAYLILGSQQDAEDAVQEAYIRAWRFRSSLDDDKKVNAWLHRVVVNSCYSKLRTEIPRRRNRLSGEGLEARPGTGPLPEDAFEQVASADVLLRAIGTLPASLRIPLVLRYFADLSEREIAIAAGCRQGTVKSRLHEARRRLADDRDIRSCVEMDDETEGALRWP
jgi:RNA polymerase sigma-70 factor (ECF subfamily)